MVRELRHANNKVARTASKIPKRCERADKKASPRVQFLAKIMMIPEKTKRMG